MPSSSSAWCGWVPTEQYTFGYLSGDREQRVEAPHPGRDRDDAPDAGGPGAGDNAVEVVGKVREVEMAMAVDKHRFLTAYVAVGSI